MKKKNGVYELMTHIWNKMITVRTYAWYFDPIGRE